MVKYKIGGMTTVEGISFVGLQTKTTVKDKDGSFLVQNFDNPAAGKKGEIPFLRGYFKLFTMFRIAFSTWFGKIILSIFVLSMLSAILAMSFGEPIPTGPQVTTWVDYMFIIINITFVIGMFFFIWRIRNLHGLEHKLIETYNKGLELTLENVKKQRKETPQCGGTFLGIILFIELIGVTIFNIPTMIVWLLIPSVGYEAFLFARGEKWYNKILFFPGILIQKITTSDNHDDDTIKKYLLGFRAFIKQEDPCYKMGFMYKNKLFDS